MKIIIKPFLLLIFFSSAIQATELNIGWDSWYPYHFKNMNNELAGLDIDILTAISEQAGLSLKYKQLIWKRHLQLMRTGKIDLASGASENKSRLDYAYFSIPYRHEYVVLFVRKGEANKIQLKKLEDLIGSDYIIGVEDGYYYGDGFQQLNQREEFKAHISTSSNLTANIQRLQKGVIDGLLADPITLKALVSQNKVPLAIEQHPIFISRENIHIMLSKKNNNETTLTKINSAINTLKQNGTILK